MSQWLLELSSICGVRKKVFMFMSVSLLSSTLFWHSNCMLKIYIITSSWAMYLQFWPKVLDHSGYLSAIFPTPYFKCWSTLYWHGHHCWTGGKWFTFTGIKMIQFFCSYITCRPVSVIWNLSSKTIWNKCTLLFYIIEINMNRILMASPSKQAQQISAE